MKKLITLTMIASFAAMSAPAFAGNNTFKTSLSYDAAAPIDVSYTQFKTQAAGICKAQIIDAGFRATESTGWQQRKCERELLSRAVKATKNNQLAVYHKRGGQFRDNSQQLASNK